MKDILFTAVTVIGVLALTACDWSSGSQENFNTSGGSTNVNVSGVYQSPNGGRVVSNTSRGNINSLTIQQSGNRVDVTDSQGSTYTGTIGAPLALASGENLSPGDQVASFQISFSGKDGVAQRDVEFTGVITVVAVTDVDSVNDLNTNSNSSSVTTTVTTNSVVEPITPDDEGAGTTTDSTETTTSNSSGSTTTNTTYTLTRNSNQMELNGTWVESGGVTSSVSGVGPAAIGNFVFLTNIANIGGGGGGGTAN